MPTDVILSGQALIQAGQQAKAHIDAAERHAGKSEEQYKAAGAYLIKAKQSVKYGHWLLWLKSYGIAQQTASLCMRIYGDPEVLTKVRERNVRAARKYKEKQTTMSHGNLHPVAPIQEDCDDCTTAEQRWERSCTSFLGDVASMEAYWRKEFGDWEKFERTTALVALAKDAADKWKKLQSILTKGTSK